MSGNGRVKEGWGQRETPHAEESSLPPVVDLSVVIVSYNTVALLRQCLKSVYAQPHSHYSFEILVVDNASSDQSATMVRAEFPQVELIANSENRGFAAATNQAIKHAHGTYLLLLNPDTEVQDEALWKMVAFLEAEPQAAVVGPALLYPDGSFQESAFKFPGLWQIFLDFYPLNWRLTRSRLNGRYPRRLFTGEFPQAFEIDFPLGACLMVRRAIVEKVGLLDEAFFMYMEEIDWCFRIKQAEMPAGYRPVGLRFRPGRRHPSRWQVYCLPAARIIHHAGASTSQSPFRQEMFYQLFKSRRHFYNKHYSHRFQVAARWLTRLGLVGKVLASGVARLRGRLSRTDFSDRLQAYRRVWRLN